MECCIQEGAIVSPNNDYDTIATFEIVAWDDYGYYLYVPHYIFIVGGVIANAYRCKSLGIEDRFRDEQIVYISEAMVVKAHKKDGMRCFCCTEFVRMAAPNQSDDKTFICWSCREREWQWK